MKFPRVPLVAALALGALPISSCAREPAAPKEPLAAEVAPDDPLSGDDDSGTVKDCLVRMEVLALPLDSARRALRQFPKQADLYAWLSTEMKKPEAAVKLERMDVIRVRGGLRSKLEAINE